MLNTGLLNTFHQVSKIPTTLKVHEWLTIIVLIATMGSLSVMAAFSRGEIGDKDRLAPVFAVSRGKIEVLIKGAVAYPGVYCLPSDILMKDVLMLAELLPDADLRRYNLDRPIKRGRTINVPARLMITVHLKGAVKTPRAISVPKGSRLEELIGMADFAENANLNVLRKKRKIKANEVIDVPFN